MPGLIEGYAAEDIYNADKTGLFFKCLPDKTYGCSNKKCHDGKKSKDQLTVMECCNMTGNDKIEFLVIYGKTQKPRCFKNVMSLPVQYFGNKKACITSALFETWLLKLVARLKAENRKVPNK
jgi:hypothetical protein